MNYLSYYHKAVWTILTTSWLLVLTPRHRQQNRRTDQLPLVYCLQSIITGSSRLPNSNSSDLRKKTGTSDEQASQLMGVESSRTSVADLYERGEQNERRSDGVPHRTHQPNGQTSCPCTDSTRTRGGRRARSSRMTDDCLQVRGTEATLERRPEIRPRRS